MNYVCIFGLFLCTLTCSAQTQTEETHRASESLRVSQEKMAQIVKHITKEYSQDSVFIRSFKASQKAWNAYINLQIKAMFPDYPEGRYGSIFPLCVSTYKKTLVEQRILEINIWLVGIEGDDCYSSVKSKSELNE